MAELLIDNCEVRFQFKCPKQWNSLRETTEAGVRSCDQCEKQVYLCQSAQEAAVHARQGHCVALPKGIASPKNSPEELERAQALARQHGVPFINLTDFLLEERVVQMVPQEMARKYGVVPLNRAGPTLVVAMSDPTNRHAIDEVKFVTGYDVEVVVAPRHGIEEALDRAWCQEDSNVDMGVIDEVTMPEVEPKPAWMEGPVGRLIEVILRDAHRKSAARIRFELTNSGARVHYEIGGSEQEATRIPLKLTTELLRQLRFGSSAGPDQEERLQLQAGDQHVRYQFHFNTTSSGEEVVLQPVPVKQDS